MRPLRRLTGWLAKRRSANSKGFWERQYGDPEAGRNWASDVRLGFYEFAAGVLPKEPLQILDLGSGLGYGGKRLAEICPLWRVEGFEISRAATEKAVIPTHCGDLARDPIPGGYDYLLLIQTLEHFRDPGAILSRVVPAARRGVVVTVPYKGKLNRKHLASLDESSFSAYRGASIELRKRVYEKDGSIKTDMRVLIPTASEAAR